MRVRVGTHGYAGAFGLPGEGGSLRIKLKESCRCPGQVAVVPSLEFGISADRGLQSELSPQSSALSPFFLRFCRMKSAKNATLNH